MKALITKASDWEFKAIREFESLENAVDTLRAETNESEYVVERFETCLLRDQYPNDIDWKITIYDSWLE
jgi:hypothetical protein